MTKVISPWRVTCGKMHTRLFVDKFVNYKLMENVIIKMKKNNLAE